MTDDPYTNNEWRDHIGARLMYAMTCTHDGDEFGDGAVCVTCFANTQAIGAIVEEEVRAARASVATAARALADEWYPGEPGPRRMTSWAQLAREGCARQLRGLLDGGVA